MLRYIFLLSLSLSVLIAEENTDYFKFSTANNINLLGQTAGEFSDDLNTGNLLLEYRHSDYIYALKLTSYTLSSPQKLFSTQNPQRVDTLIFSFGKHINTYNLYNSHINIYLFAEVKGTGNFGGEKLQTFIHKITDNSKKNLPYSNDTSKSLGIQCNIETYFPIDNQHIFYTDTHINAHTDKSAYISNELGIEGSYKYVQLKLSLNNRYIKAQDHELIELATLNKSPTYLLGEIGFNFSQNTRLYIGSKISGDHPLGNFSSDVYSYISLIYKY